MNDKSDAWKSLPESWRAVVREQVAEGERVVSWFEPDLDATLRYASGLLVLTDRRLLVWASSAAGDADSTAKTRPAETWSLPQADHELAADERGGAGSLELVGSDRRVAVWRYTAGRASAAHRLVRMFDRVNGGQTRGDDTGTVCPSCGELITSDDGLCPNCSPASTTPPMSSLIRLLIFAKPVHKYMLVGFVLTLISSAVGLIPAYLVKPMTKILLLSSEGAAVDVRRFWWLFGGMVGGTVLAWLLDWIRSYTNAWIGERISADLRMRTFAHLQKLSLEFFGGKRTGDLMSRISNNTERLCNFLAINVSGFVTDILLIVMTASLMLATDLWLATVALLPFPLIFGLVHVVRKRLRRGFAQAEIAWATMTSVLADAIPGIRVVKAFAQERREVERFRHSNDRVMEVNDRMNLVWSFFGPFMVFLTECGLLVVWAVGSSRVFNRETEYEVLVMFLFLITKVYTRFEALIMMIAATQRAAAAAQRLFEILDRVPSVPEPTRPQHPERWLGGIELQGLRFKYGSREVLHGLDLAIKPGEMIGLVGPSGAGKSTLINLICRFYDVAEGAIRIDGIDVRSLAVEEYRKHIGIVLQDPFLFYGTISENVAYGRPDATRAEIVAAARAAHAHDFILRLPDGYDSLVGERGQSLSGGERQRISIARALLINPLILILDEATSSVDTETEREIQAALEHLVQGRTTIAIAHRLSTLRRANRLVVIEAGEIKEIGNHDELLRNNGVYARLHRAQVELAQGIGI